MSESLLVQILVPGVRIDETAGLQDDDVDLGVTPLPTDFAARLSALGAPASPDEAAVSSDSAVQYSPTGTLGNVALTGSDGEPLNGVDSGFDRTSTGNDILLYTDTANDNIVLGKDAGTGDIVFAIYLTEPAGDPLESSLWVVEYDAIEHDGADQLNDGDGNDHDASYDLTGLVHVTAFEAQTFSFANAPSGSNLFMAFGDENQALVITGENPANESAGENVSSGSTVNSSQGGGTTTLGIDGQQIKAQQAIVVTFVTGAEADYLAGPGAGNDPGQPLSPTEALDEANIQFNDYLLAQAAEFTISQMTPGKSNTTTSLEIHAYLTADGSGDAYIDNDPLVDGDTAINITTDSVQVLRGGVDVVGTLGVTVDYTGDGAVIAGVKNGDVVRYETDADHNRVLIRNDQPEKGSGSNVAFDLGGFTLTEVAGDTDEVGSKIFFDDDGPAIDLTPLAPTIAVDESLGTAGSSKDEPGDALPDDETAAGAPVGAIGYAVTLASALFSETAEAGTDGEASKVYALVLTAGATGLTDTATDEAVVLVDNGGVIEGRTSGTDALVFTIAVDGTTGDVTTTQFRALDHGDDSNDHDSAVSMASGLVELEATLTDGDTDTAADKIELGSLIGFEDDGPAIDLTPLAPTIAVDESLGTAGSSKDEPGDALPDDETAAGAPVGAIGYAVTLASALFSETAEAGTDGEASKVYALVLTAGATGLTDTATDEAVVLVDNGGVIEGRTSGTDALVFTVAVDGTTGDVTTTQFRALDHGDDSNDHDSAVSMASGLVELEATLTDGDTDTAADKIELGSLIGFEDDGPDVTVDDASGTYQAGADGTWSDLPGADGFDSLNVTFDSFEIDANGTQTTSTTNSTFARTGDLSWAGSVTDDFTDDGQINEQTVEFTLTFDPDADTYRVDIGELPTSTSTFDTSQGKLAAGGPDPVQTLLFGGSDAGNDDIVFIGVVATAPKLGEAGGNALADPKETPNDLLDLVYPGATDLTEQQIQAFLTPTNQIPGLINSATQMNVSTSGIGINNNNLDGTTAGIQSGDESFIVNPETLVDSMKVYISSTVQGYDPGSEELYYSVYYDDGTVSGPTKVTEGMLTHYANNDTSVPKEAKGGSSFTIEGGDKQIDAVQLTMGQGTVKIPIIAFTVEEEFDPESLEMNFTATLEDGDEDTAVDTFSVDFAEATVPETLSVEADYLL